MVRSPPPAAAKERALGTIPQSALRATFTGGSCSHKMGFRLYEYLSGHPINGIFWGGILALLGLVISI